MCGSNQITISWRSSLANDDAVMKLFTAEKRPPSNAILATTTDTRRTLQIFTHRTPGLLASGRAESLAELVETQTEETVTRHRKS